MLADTGASLSFIAKHKAQELGLTTEVCPPIRVVHSNQSKERSTTLVRAAHLKLGHGWGAPIDLHVLDHLGPHQQIIMGQSFMQPRNAHLKLHRDGTTCLEMTLGPRRIELQADVPNETYLQAAAPLASISSTTQAATLTTWRDRIKAMPTETTYPLTPTQHARLDSLPHRFPQVYEEPTYDTHVDHPLGEQQLVVTAGAVLPQRRQPRPLSKAKADALLAILNKLETKG